MTNQEVAIPVQLIIDDKKRTVTFTLPLADLQPSKSGKTLRVASTEGGLRTGVLFRGRPVTVNFNAYISADE